MDVFMFFLIFVLLIILLRSIVQINEYERGIKLEKRTVLLQKPDGRK